MLDGYDRFACVLSPSDVQKKQKQPVTEPFWFRQLAVYSESGILSEDPLALRQSVSGFLPNLSD
jgi:hypothetical protein